MTWRVISGRPWAKVIFFNAILTYVVLRVKGG